MTNRFILFLIIILSFCEGQTITPLEVMERVYAMKKPITSIMEIKLEVTRKKGKKEKTKNREFTRYEKFYDSGKYRLKSLARFTMPKMVKGTGLLSWVKRNGQTDQWFFLPKLKTAKKVKAKERSRSFLNTDFIYEDLQNRKPGLDSLVDVGNEFIEGRQCKIIMAWPNDESHYFSRKIWIDTQRWQVIKVEYYSSESNKEKTLILSDFIDKNGFSTAGKLVMDRGDGNKTVMRIMTFRPDMGLKEEIFSKSFLIKI